MTDYKQLCAELLEWAERTSSHYYKQADVIIRARAALAEPEPEGPTDTELSPSARAVLAAINKELDEAPWDLTFIAGSAAAAALHAAAYQLLAVQWNGQMPISATEQIGINWARDALHVLANELETF